MDGGGQVFLGGAKAEGIKGAGAEQLLQATALIAFGGKNFHVGDRKGFSGHIGKGLIGTAEDLIEGFGEGIPGISGEFGGGGAFAAEHEIHQLRAFIQWQGEEHGA